MISQPLRDSICQFGVGFWLSFIVQQAVALFVTLCSTSSLPNTHYMRLVHFLYLVSSRLLSDQGIELLRMTTKHDIFILEERSDA